MTNTKKFFEAIKDFRVDMRALEKEYQEKLKRLEPYQGSKGYTDGKDTLDADRSENLQNIRDVYKKRFDAILSDMETAFASKPMTPPTAEQLALLQVLKMRTSISSEEIRRAANTLKDCPAAMQVLKEIAEKCGARLTVDAGIAASTVTDNLQSLRRNTEQMLHRMDRVDNRAETVNSGAFELFHLDTDPKDEADALRIFAYARDPERFSAAVNGEA